MPQSDPKSDTTLYHGQVFYVLSIKGVIHRWQDGLLINLALFVVEKKKKRLKSVQHANFCSAAADN